MTNEFDSMRKSNFQMYLEAGAMNSNQEQVPDIKAFRKAHCIPDDTHVLVRQRVVGIVSQYADTRSPFLPNINQPMSVTRLWQLCHLLSTGSTPPVPGYVGGTYPEAVRVIGEFPEEYIQPLAFYGISKLMNEALSRETWFARIKESMDRNPELGYLALTRSPRSDVVINSESFFFYMHGAMVGLLMGKGVVEKEIFKEVTKHNLTLRLIALGMSWGRDSKYLQISSSAMIKLAVALLDGNYGGFDTIEFAVKEFPSGIQLQGDSVLPALSNVGPLLDTIVSYKGKTVTQREAIELMNEEVRAIVKDTEVAFITPDSSIEAKDAAIKNIAGSLGCNETDVLVMYNSTLNEPGATSLTQLKSRGCGEFDYNFNSGKSDIRGMLIRKLIDKGYDIEVQTNDMEGGGHRPVNIAVLGAVVPIGKSMIKSMLEESARSIVALESIDTLGYGKGDTFVTKSNRDEVIAGKNRSWPKPKARKGYRK